MLIKIERPKRKFLAPPQLVNQFRMALIQFANMERQKKITPALESEIIAIVRDYSTHNRLPFDGTLKGCFKLAEEADRTCKDHVSRLTAIRDAPRSAGKRRVITTRG